ncbi:MAG TPA: hypothetical protein QF646_02055 [Candidatus Poseidoniales archaeon]|nr:hypothetical protein [Candidatus Poseidoniales archaeon]
MINVAAPRMTSVSVSYETRRLLNTMKSMEGFGSIDELLKHLTRSHSLQRLHGVREDLRGRIKALENVDAEELVRALRQRREHT